MNYYLTMLMKSGAVVQHGWMMAETDNELVVYARNMGYGIDLTYLGEADMSSETPRIVPGTESEMARRPARDGGLR
jgi:hypothetical protein